MAVLYPTLIAVAIFLAPSLRSNPIAFSTSTLIFLALAYGKWLDMRGKQAMIAHNRR